MVNELDGAVAPTVADDGLDGGVAECPADVADALGHGAGILSVGYLIWQSSSLRVLQVIG